MKCLFIMVYSSIVHGDLHKNNIRFDSTVAKYKIIDFGKCRLGSTDIYGY